LGVGLPDRLVHFATQCIKVDVHNTSSEMHQVYKKRAQAFLNMGRYDQAREDLENALHLANNTTELEGQAEQVS
jgi:Tfp pilus assembly protein PilF